MTDVSKITKQLQGLRLKSELKRANRAAKGSGQNEAGAAASGNGSESGPAKVAKTARVRAKQSKAVNKLATARPKRRNTASGSIRPLASLMKKAVNEAMPHTQFVANVKAFQKRMLNGELPYKRNVEHEGIPVVTSVAHSRSNEQLEFSTRAVTTEYGPGIEFTGEEYLFSAATSVNTYSQGNTIVAFPLNPRVLTTPRLRLFAQLFTRFIFKEAELIYEHTAGTQNNGSISMFGVYDPTVNPCIKPGDPLIGYAANKRAPQCGVFEDAKVVMNDVHFKDMLFLEADDDLRWTLQGVMFAISVGTIATNLEMGQFKLRYKVIMANDDLDEDEEMTTRSYSGSILTSALGVVGQEIQFTNSLAAPAGKYWATVRADPSSPLNAWKDRDAYEQNDAKQSYPIIKGTGFYLIVPNSGNIRAYVAPDLFNEIGQGNGKMMLYANAANSGTSLAVQMYRLSD